MIACQESVLITRPTHLLPFPPSSYSNEQSRKSVRMSPSALALVLTIRRDSLPAQSMYFPHPNRPGCSQIIISSRPRPSIDKLRRRLKTRALRKPSSRRYHLIDPCNPSCMLMLLPGSDARQQRWGQNLCFQCYPQEERIFEPAQTCQSDRRSSKSC